MDKETEHVYNKLFAPETVRKAYEDCHIRHVLGISIVGVMYLWVTSVMVFYWIDCGG